MSVFNEIYQLLYRLDGKDISDDYAKLLNIIKSDLQEMAEKVDPPKTYFTVRCEAVFFTNSHENAAREFVEWWKESDGDNIFLDVTNDNTRSQKEIYTDDL